MDARTRTLLTLVFVVPLFNEEEFVEKLWKELGEVAKTFISPYELS